MESHPNWASALTSTLCLTETPPKSVTLAPDSTLMRMHGGQLPLQCAVNTPTLGLRPVDHSGPFTAVSCGHEVHLRATVPHFEAQLERHGDSRRADIGPGPRIGGAAWAVGLQPDAGDGGVRDGWRGTIRNDDLVPTRRLGAEERGVGQ